MRLDDVGATRRAILVALKRDGPLTVAALARRLGVTGEAVRQGLARLEREGWVERARGRRPHGAGRPPGVYRLAPAGEELFPKRYPDLATGLLDAVAAVLGEEALRRVLAAVAEAQARRWEPLLQGLDLRRRLEALRSLYAPDDPFSQVEETPDGYLLVERNCPYLAVALRRPALCSVTVSVLTRLLGCRVVRERRFQDGDGCCAFRVLPSEPVDPEAFGYFAPEPARAGSEDGRGRGARVRPGDAGSRDPAGTEAAGS